MPKVIFEGETQQEIVQQVWPGDIVLLHDDNPHITTVLDPALPRIRRRLPLDRALVHVAGAR